MKLTSGHTDMAKIARGREIHDEIELRRDVRYADKLV